MKSLYRLTRLALVAMVGLAVAGCTEISAVNQAVNQPAQTATPVEDPSLAAAPTDNQGGVNIGTADAPAFVAADAPDSAVIAAREIAEIPPFALQNFYRSLGVQNVWGQNGGWLTGAAQLVDVLNASYAHGLQPNAYLPATIDPGTHSPAADQQLSAGMIKYISDLRYGRTRGNYLQASQDAARIIRSGQSIADGLTALEPQGYFYQRTKTAAKAALSQRGARAPKFASLEVTMEKLRTQGEPQVNVGRKVLVNIAAFDLQAWDSGRMELSSNVVVGQEGRDTPLGPDSITNLKFSPDWNAPRSIIEKDLYPKLLENPAQFSRFGLRVLLNDRLVIDPTTINWAGISPQQIHVKQIPGPWNVLGGVRFTLSNSQSVYLHDTSSRDPFRNFERADSSGCVRVEKSKELADWILRKDGQPLPDPELAERMDRGDVNYVYLRNSMPVEMVYYTAWVDGEGNLKLVRDIYGRESDLRQRLNVGI